MSAEATGWVWKYSPKDHSGAVFTVHKAIADTVNDANDNEFYMTMTELALKARMSRSTVVSSVQRLVAEGFLEELVAPTKSVAGRYRFLEPDVRVLERTYHEAVDGRDGKLEPLAVVWEPRRQRKARAARARAASSGGVVSDDTPVNGEVRDLRTPSAATGVVPPRAPESGGVVSDDTPAGEGVRDQTTEVRDLRSGGARPDDTGARSPVTEVATGARSPVTELELKRTQEELNELASISPIDAKATADEVVSIEAHTRRRDLLWEAVMAALGLNDRELSTTERGAANKAVGDLRRMGVEPETVERRAQAYRLLYPTAALTPTALVRHWGECNPERVTAELATAGQTSGNRLALAQATARRTGRAQPVIDR